MPDAKKLQYPLDKLENICYTITVVYYKNIVRLNL